MTPIENANEHYIFGCELIQEAVILLRLSQIIAITAQSILHRFYRTESLLKTDVFSIAMASVLLASKVEECTQSVTDVAYVFHHIYQCRRSFQLSSLNSNDSKFLMWTRQICDTEMKILKTLGFGFYNVIEAPHKFLLYFIRLIDGTNDLAQTSWNYLNDSARLDICLKYEPQEIVGACIYLSARKLQFPLPISSDGKSWWMLMSNSFEKIETIAILLLKLYYQKNIAWVIPLAKVEFLSESISGICRDTIADINNNRYETYDKYDPNGTAKSYSEDYRSKRKRSGSPNLRNNSPQRDRFEKCSSYNSYDRSQNFRSRFDIR